MDPEVKRPVAVGEALRATSSELPSRKRMSKNMLIGGIVAAIIVAGVAVYGVYAYVSNQPDNVLQSALSTLANQKSLAAQFTIVTGTNPSVTTKGDIASISDTANNKNGEVIIGLGSGNNRVSVNALSLDGSLYLKAMNVEGLTKLLAAQSSPSDAAILSAPDLAASLKNIDNQWFGFTKTDIQSLAQTSGNDSVAGAVSPDDLKRVSQIYMQHELIKVDKAYDDVVLDGTKVAHFSLKVDQTTEIAFLQAVKSANLSTIKVTDADIASAQHTTDTKDLIFEVWIARDTKSFKQVKMTDTKKGSEATITVTFTATLPTFDPFIKPAQSKSFSDILSVLLSSSMNADQLNAMQQLQ